jgi:hypothetical protein
MKMSLISSIGVAALTIIFSSGCAYTGVGGHGGGGDDYTLREESVDKSQVQSKTVAVYDEASESLKITAWFQQSGSSVRGMDQLQDIQLMNGSSVSIDGQTMQFQKFDSYVGDDSKSSTVGCSYVFKADHVHRSDLNRSLTFSWTDKQGRRYENEIRIPAAVTFVNVPASASSTLGLSVTYAGAIVNNSEKVLVGIQSSGIYPSLEFPRGSANLIIPASPYLTAGSKLELTPIHRSADQAVDLPAGGGSIASEYHATSVVVAVD